MTALLQPIITVFIATLEFFYGLVHSYGWSIILLTLAVRVFLLPLTIKQSRAMKDMQRVQPKIKALQEKYKNDKEKLGQETLKLYKEHKVNPFSSCLPLLLQLPVFFSLFTVLRTYPALQNQGFWVIQNLSYAPSKFGINGLTAQLGQAFPYYILIALIAATTYFSQKQTTTDPAQARMMAFMPVLIGVISYTLPAGVLLYWITFNAAMIVQQYITDTVMETGEVQVASPKRKK